MPLREVSDINARYGSRSISFSALIIDLNIFLNKFRLDAVQDIMNHSTFEATFTSIAKGLPDLERVVARIHAKNCRIKDFVKVLGVSLSFLESISC